MSSRNFGSHLAPAAALLALAFVTPAFAEARAPASFSGDGIGPGQRIIVLHQRRGGDALVLVAPADQRIAWTRVEIEGIRVLERMP